MTEHVIDTNVLSVANGRHPEAGPQCVAACVGYLLEVQGQGVVLLDTGRRILGEYERNLVRGGQPRTGWAFYKWLRDHPRSRRAIPIYPVPGMAEDYREFPRDPGLAGFDPSDRKFVAVALASGTNPTVANAVDSDWADYHVALAHHGVRVRFLCPERCAPVPDEDANSLAR